jgi:hypothetical protein
MVLSGDALLARVAALRFVLDVGERSLTLLNFAAVAAVVSALCHELINAHAMPAEWAVSMMQRDVIACALTRSCQQLHLDEKARIATLSVAVSTTQSFAAYRERIRAARAPGVPLLEALAHDMTQAARAALLDTATALGGAAANSGTASSVSELMPDVKVAPPTRLEADTVIHVGAWLRVAPFIAEFVAWQQVPYAVHTLAVDAALLAAVRDASDHFIDSNTLRDRAAALVRVVAAPTDSS